MVLDPQVVAALIEMQTTGRVVPRPAEPRAPTRTDAIMCADFIDRLLELIDRRAAEAELDVAPAISGFRYGLALAETRAIGLALEDIPYRAFGFDVDLGRGAKSGSVQLLLPFDPPGVARTGHAEAAAFAEAMRAQVLETQAVLSATLLRRRMSLAEVTGLEVGSRLHLPRAALSSITVEALDGTVVAAGRLGQMNGHRAVRLVVPGDTAAMAAAQMPAPELALPPAGVPVPDPAPPDALAPEPAALGGLGTADAGETPQGLGDPAGLGDLGDSATAADPGVQEH
jgi:flagellar motor switch protein FliM